MKLKKIHTNAGVYIDIWGNKKDFFLKLTFESGNISLFSKNIKDKAAIFQTLVNLIENELGGLAPTPKCDIWFEAIKDKYCDNIEKKKRLEQSRIKIETISV
jgi:hypothetical protein